MNKLPTRGFRGRITPNMSKKIPRLKLKTKWRHYPAGAIIQPPGVLRQVLVQEGIGEIIKDEVIPEAPPIVEESAETEEAQEETPIVPKRRGRPPKVKTDDVSSDD